MRYMLTLTFPAPGVHDYGVAEQLVAEWLRRNVQLVSASRRYVAVAELHPGGHGWHWHILTDAYLQVQKLRISWTRWCTRYGLYPPPGRWVRIDAKVWRDGKAAAFYAGKYVTKKCEVPPGRHRYLMSNAAQPPDAVVGLCSAWTPNEVLEQLYAWGLPVDAWTRIGSTNDETWSGPELVLARF